MSSALHQYLHSAGQFPEELITAIVDKFSIIKLKRNEFFLKEGEICKSLGFVESGLFVYYKTADNGKESVCDFAQENSWVSQYQSFVQRTPSVLFIKALEPCIVHTISLAQLNSLYLSIPGFERLSREVVEQTFMEMVNRQLEFQSLQAEERYEKFQRMHPTLLQRAPQYYIASYLNIAPPSLSRIRKNQ
jgi:CRP-like cAMP-binding protein